ncbi:protein PAM71-homolog, chloroplastic isoform X2 [Abrus precatorius]|uniref:GDT1 family protein n=1 Tax=Abrus precatorius TaxID=3816 RepID=A0A8B8MDV6_ABRPR|nr:protein PAM71-homolog, chloroplastic isoform X2 [Abrus precatorius]
MQGLGSHAPLVSRGKAPPLLPLVHALPSSTYLSTTAILSPLRWRHKSRLSLAHGTIRAQASNVSGVGSGDYGRWRHKSRLSLAHGTIRAQASNVSGVGSGDYGSNGEKDSQNVFEGNAINDSSSKVVKPPNQIPYPLSIAFVLLGCSLVFSLIAFVKGGPSSVLAAIAKSGFTAAFTLIFVSEIGDKTFFIATLLAMQYEKGLVLLGAMGALALMSILSVVIGRIFQSVPAQFQTTIPIGAYAAVALLLFFGLKSIKDAWDLPSDVVKKGDNSIPELDELAEAEELVKEKASDGLSNPLEIIWKSFSLVFFAEWGDRSMLATIALAAAQSPWGVASGAIAGHLLATSIAILGGAFLANYISEKLVGYLGGGLFLIFAVATLFGVF